MDAVLPRHVLCILGGWRDLDRVDEIARAHGGFELDRQYSRLSMDARMVLAFESSADRVIPSMTEDDRRAVREHSAVAYVLSQPMSKGSEFDTSGQALALVATLLRENGVAAKAESSGIAHGRERWLELAEEYINATRRNDAQDAGAALYRAWVRRAIQDNDDALYYSCGMHLLGERDIELPSSEEVGTALEWMDLLGYYLAVDRPERVVQDGEGFRPQQAGPRRVMRLRTCERYEPDDFFFNPYGYIRLEQDA